MYQYVKTLTKNDNMGVVSAGFYMMMPYHLTDMYIRNALGEFLAFIFIPIVFLGLYEILEMRKFTLNLSIGASLLLLTHNISTLITCFFAVIYIIIHITSLREKGVLKNLVISAFIILLLTSFYWVPLLEHKSATQYHVFVEDAMGSMEDLMNKRLSVKELFYTEKEAAFVFHIGILSIITLSLGIFAIRKIEKEIIKDYITFFLLGFICMIASTKIFPWDKLPNGVKIIQFSWRLLQFSSFFFSIIGAINIVSMIKKYKTLSTIFLFIIGIILLSLTFYSHILFASEELEFSAESAGRIESNITQSSSSIIGIAKAEYLPEKAYQNMDYIINRKNTIHILEGEAEIQNEIKNGTNLEASINSTTDKLVIELPYIYYLGYHVQINHENVATFETNNGFLGIELNHPTRGQLTVSYLGTVKMKISLIISIITTCTVIAVVIKKRIISIK